MTAHDPGWVQNIHQQPMWKCPVTTHDTSVLFSSPEGLHGHMSMLHPNLNSEEICDGVEGGIHERAAELRFGQRVDICPLCSMPAVTGEQSLPSIPAASAQKNQLDPGKKRSLSPPENIDKKRAKLPEASTANEGSQAGASSSSSDQMQSHIAEHMLSLMILTLRLMDVQDRNSSVDEDAMTDTPEPTICSSIQQRYLEAPNNLAGDWETEVPEDDEIAQLQQDNAIPETDPVDWRPMEENKQRLNPHLTDISNDHVLAKMIANHTERPQDGLFPGNSIPFPVNPNFLGREKELDQVRTHLDNTDGPNEPFRTLILCGLCGIGKTQIALAYAHEQIAAGTEAVLWFNWGTFDSLERSLTAVAPLFDRMGGSELPKSSSEKIATLLQWLDQTSKHFQSCNLLNLVIVRFVFCLGTQGLHCLM